jgi:predicted NAD-dependent protein-ADP-ribosyltransferase YbiA (DUF1768 family)
MSDPNDVPPYLRYIRLEKIREVFAARYAFWRFTLPELILPSGSPLDDDHDFSGWSIAYALGHDEDGAPCLYVSDDHRMTSPGFYRIREDGDVRKYASYALFGYDPNVEGDHERKKIACYRENQRIGATHRLLGFGLGAADYDYYPERAGFWKELDDEKIRGIVRSQEAEAERLGESESNGEVFFADDSPFALTAPAPFRAFELDFHSAAHYFSWLRAVHAGDAAAAAERYAAKPNDACLTALTRRQTEPPANIYERRFETWWLYTVCRHKFQQNEPLKEALLATRGRLVYVSARDPSWGRAPNAPVEREELGNCFGAALSLLRGDLHRVAASAP